MKNKKKTVLFLSANDFKENSIQVLLKTPLAYVKEGWNVIYIVARDNSNKGNYYYEPEINPSNVNVIRFEIPFTNWINKINNRILSLLLQKIRYWLAIVKLYKEGKKIIKRDKNIDVIYGYEVHGVLASILLRKRFRNFKNTKYINRFQGTFLYDYFRNFNIKKLLIRIEDIIALKSKAHLIIMTDDGTQGDKALKLLKSKNKILFLPNGVDRFKLNEEKYHQLIQKYKQNNEFIILSVSRLVDWKRVDRNLNILHELVFSYQMKNVKYLIVGEGPLRDNLRRLSEELKIEKYVEFCGSVPHRELGTYYKLADVFLSMYDGSNVGNPLFEALLNEKIIFTLNNGDTSNWIKNEYNGYIFEVEESYSEIAKKIQEIKNDEILKNTITENIRIENSKKLWSWDERLKYEIDAIEELLKQ